MDEKHEDLKAADEYLKNNLFVPAARCFASVADKLEKAGNFKEAEQIFQNIIDCYDKEAELNIKDKKYDEAAEILLTAGELEKKLNDIDSAIKYYKKAVEQYLKAATQFSKGKDYQNAGNYFKKAAFYSEVEIQDEHSAKDNYQNAIESYKQFIGRIIEEKDFKTAAQFMQLIALLYEKIENYENAIEFDEKSLDLASKGEFIQIVTDSYLHKANCFLKLNKKNEMKATLHHAKDHISKMGKKYLDNGQYLDAAESFDQTALILEEMMKNFPENKNLLKELNNSYINKAESYLKVAENDLKIGEIERAAHFKRNSALTYQITKEHEKAANLFFEAGRHFEDLHNFKLASINYRDSGIQYEILKDSNKAGELLLKAGELAKKTGVIEMSLECFRAALRNYGCDKDAPKSIQILEELEYLLKMLAREEENEENYHIAASYLFELGNYYDSLDDLNSANNFYNDSIRRFQKAINLAIKDKQFNIAAYSLSCNVILNLILNDMKNAGMIIDKYQDSLNDFRYFSFCDELYQVINAKTADLSSVLAKYNKMIKASDELDFLIMKLKEKLKNS